MLKMVASKVEFCASFETHFFRIAGTLETKTFGYWKTQCLLIALHRVQTN